MTDQQIIEKIKYGFALATELPDLEFKTARNNIPNDIWRTISAFANRRGGGVAALPCLELIKEEMPLRGERI